MGIFDGIETATGAAQRRDKIVDGRYVFRIDEIKYTESKEKPGNYFYVIEMTVMKVLDNYTGKGNRVGQEVAHLIKKNRFFLDNVARFIAAVTGCERPQVTPQHAEVTLSDKRPFSGVMVEASAKTITMKLKPEQAAAGQTVGDPFTEVTYHRRIDDLDSVAPVAA